MALNTALTWRRKTAPAAAALVPVPASLPEPAGEVSPRDPLHLLEEFLAALNPVDRAILLLYLEGAGYAEISNVTGLSEGNVGVRINRIKRSFVDTYIGE